MMGGGTGNDTIDGGIGENTIVEVANANFTLTDTTLTGNGNDTLTQIEAAEVTGGSGNNVIKAVEVTQMNVTLDGAAGNDNVVMVMIILKEEMVTTISTVKMATIPFMDKMAMTISTVD